MNVHKRSKRIINSCEILTMKCNPAVVAWFVGASGKNTGHLQVED